MRIQRLVVFADDSAERWLTGSGLAAHGVGTREVLPLIGSPQMDRRGQPVWSTASRDAAVSILAPIIDYRYRTQGVFTWLRLGDIPEVLAQGIPHPSLGYRIEIWAEPATVVPDFLKSYPRVHPAMLSARQGVDLEDLSGYRMIHHFGDLHGSYSVLQTYLGESLALQEDEFYIFCGDYVDRGTQHDRLIPWLLENSCRENVRILEGNHERQLRFWSHGCRKDCSPLFLERTLPDFEATVSQEAIRDFCDQLSLGFAYTYQGNTVLATHGGLAQFPENFLQVSAREYTHGSGHYDAAVDRWFSANTPETFWQVHGHRNPNRKPIRDGRGFCLEGQVEAGGHLRIAVLSASGWNTHAIHNPVTSFWQVA